MKIIDVRELDLKDAIKITKGTFESDIYVKDGKAYKIFKTYKFFKDKWRILDKKHKALLLEDSISKQIVKPDGIIMKKGEICGLRTDYIDNLGTLYDISKVYNDVSKFLRIMYSSSQGLKDIHADPLDICVNDLTFYNIIFDEFFNTYYVDADSYEVGRFSASSIADNVYKYCKKRGINPYYACPTLDRFQFAYNFIETLMGKSIRDISLYQFDELAERIKTLKNMREYFKKIKKSKKVPDVPYLCDLISDADLTTKIEYELPIITNNYLTKQGKELTRRSK